LASSRRLVFVALAAGCVSGGIISIGLQSWFDRTPSTTARSTPSAAAPESAAQGVTPNTGNRAIGEVKRKLSSVEERLEDLEQRRESPADEAAPANGNPGEPQAEEIHARVAESIREHEAEPVDPTWAPAANQALGRDLGSVSKATGVAISNINCRNTSCVATAQWKDRETATRDYELLLRYPFRVNCERTVVLPPATAGETTVAASLVLNCESWRAAGSQMISEDQLAGFSLAARPIPVEK